MGWTDHCVLKGGIKRGGLTIVYFRGVLNGDGLTIVSFRGY